MLNRISTSARLGLSVVAGGLAGLMLGTRAVLLQPLADVFLAALQAVGLPVALFALLSSVRLLSTQRLTGLGLRSLAWYLATALAASVVGVLAAYALSIGSGFDLFAASEASTTVPRAAPATAKGFRSALGGPLPHVIFWTLLLALLARRANSVQPDAETSRWSRLLEESTRIAYRLLGGVMVCAPVGVFALMAIAFAQLHVAAAVQLMKVVVAVYLAQAIICLGCGVALWRASQDLRAFLSGASEALLTAFATGSSAATMPVEIAAAQQRLGVDPKLVGIVLPLGLAVHKLGSAAYLAAVLVFASNAAKLELTPVMLAWLTLLTLGASIITPPVSGGTLAALALVAGGAGVPMSAVTLAATIPLLGKLNTPINSLGRLMSVAAISNWMKTPFNRVAGA